MHLACLDLPRQIVASVKGEASDSDDEDDEHVSSILQRLQFLRKPATPMKNHTLPAAAPHQNFIHVALSPNLACKECGF